MLNIGVQTGCFVREGHLDEDFRTLAECGFDCVDINLPSMEGTSDRVSDMESVAFWQRPLEEIIALHMPYREAAERHGISFSQGHAPFPLAIEGEDALNDVLIRTVAYKSIALAAALNCPNLVVHPVSRDTKEQEWADNMKLYRALMPYAKEFGVKICLENLFTTSTGRLCAGACATADEACRYVDALNAEAGADCFGFCFDVGHANLVHTDMREYLRTLGKRLTVLHIHDNDGVDDLHLIPYSQARYRKSCTLALDWEGFLKGLRDIGYSGALSFETFRVMRLIPRELHTPTLRYLAEIGSYFKSRIEQ